MQAISSNASIAGRLSFVIEGTQLRSADLLEFGSDPAPVLNPVPVCHSLSPQDLEDMIAFRGDVKPHHYYRFITGGCTPATL